VTAKRGEQKVRNHVAKKRKESNKGHGKGTNKEHSGEKSCRRVCEGRERTERNDVVQKERKRANQRNEEKEKG